jgi:hypothetical protein
VDGVDFVRPMLEPRLANVLRYGFRCCLRVSAMPGAILS